MFDPMRLSRFFMRGVFLYCRVPDETKYIRSPWHFSMARHAYDVPMLNHKGKRPIITMESFPTGYSKAGHNSHPALTAPPSFISLAGRKGTPGYQLSRR